MDILEITKKPSKLNINYALQPAKYVLLFLGIEKYTFELNKVVPRTICSKIYSSVLLFSLIISFIYIMKFKVTEELVNSTLSLVFTDNIAHLLSFSATISAILCPLFFTNISIKFINNVEYIDKLLDLPPECYMKMRTTFTRGILFVCLFVTAFVISDFIFWYSSIIAYMTVIYFSDYVVGLVIFQYVVDIWIITFRMRALVSLLITCKNLKLNTDFAPNNLMFIKSWNQMIKLNSKSNVSDDFGDRIARGRSIYDKLADNVDIINSSYGSQVMLKIYICDFVVIIYKL